MNEQLDVLDLIKLAINEFVEKEKFLLENNLNERTITHKLANYIEKYFSNYDVDCEYNRMEDESEEYITKTLALIGNSDGKNNGKKIVYPDIIVHKRGTNDKNLLIIEAKKSNYAGHPYNTINNNEIKRQKEFDKIKIKAYMDEEQLNYKYGLYLEFEDEKTNYEGEFYFSGKKIKFKN